MSALIIGERERAEIAKVIRQATENPISLSKIREQAISQPPPGQRGNPTVILPIGYGVSFTIEEQPFGVSRHISISVDRPGMLPNVEAVNWILEEFGFVNRVGELYVFLEDIGSSEKAVNCLEPLDGDMRKLK